MTAKRPLKTQLVELLLLDQTDEIVALSARQKRTLSLLTGLSYHSSAQIANAAVRAFGPAAHEIARQDPEYVRIHLRRLFWLVNDESGGIGWRAPELIGQVLAWCPEMFDEFISPLVHLLDMEPEDAPRFRPGVLIAIEYLVQARPEIRARVLASASPFLP